MPALTCPDCHQTYHPKSGHCRGGKYGGCCKSFHASADFDLHRTGSADARRCRTTDELTESKWQQIDGRWTSPQSIAAAESVRARLSRAQAS